MAYKKEFAEECQEIRGFSRKMWRTKKACPVFEGQAFSVLVLMRDDSLSRNYEARCLSPCSTLSGCDVAVSFRTAQA